MDAKKEFDAVERAAQQLKRVFGTIPQTCVVLGSGFGSIVDAIQIETSISFAEIEGFPVSTVAGHAGRMVTGVLGGERVLLSVGRLHYYEGWTANEVMRLVRSLAWAGGSEFLLTNAAGGLHNTFRPGDFLLIRDHLNGLGFNPLRGPNIEAFGPRFPDLTQVYDPELRKRFKAAASACGVNLHDGVYLALQGPTYETPAEIESFRRMGADCVGMSTVPEAIALRHMRRKVIALSLISNLAAGFEPELSHTEVLEQGKASAGLFAKILEKYISTARG